MAGIWVYGDNHEQCLELMTVGRGLADTLGTTLSVLVPGGARKAVDYGDYGADEVLLMPERPSDQSHDVYVPVIAREALQADPDVILVAATVRGGELAARIAVRLGTGLCSGCISLDYDEAEGRLLMQRFAYGGSVLQTVVCQGRPVMAAVPPRTFEPSLPRPGRKAVLRELPQAGPSALRILEGRTRERQARDIRDAPVVVALGRGFEKQDDLSLAEELATSLGGEIGCTRPLSDEYHWLPEGLCIGLSGADIQPDLYLGLGISGQIQHVTGIRNARVIAAVNRDEKAPIFDTADVGIVGDLYAVIPLLTAALKE